LIHINFVVGFSFMVSETLDFKFLLKPKNGVSPCVVEEGPTRLLTGGLLEGEARHAIFKLNGGEEMLEYKVFIKADIVSPLDLAASWRAYKENLQPSRVRGIPDVTINVAPDGAVEVVLLILIILFLFSLFLFFTILVIILESLILN
jgi:hypothetical protein